MNLVSLLKVEGYKQKRGLLWLFLLIIPAGTTLAMYLDMKLRYADYLLPRAKEEGMNSWELLMQENHAVLGWGAFLPLFIGIIFTLLHQIELNESSWKYYLSLPVRRGMVFTSKYIVGYIAGAILVIGNTLGLILVGLVIGFPESVDWALYGMYVLQQVIAIFAVAAIQNWLSSYYQNLILPVVIAFLGIIVAVALPARLARFFPYSFASFVGNTDEKQLLLVMLVSTLIGATAMLFGARHFQGKDIM